MAGENIPVPLPPVRVGVLPENIHQAIKASDGDTAACRIDCLLFIEV